jgi:hypothetical protein
VALDEDPTNPATYWNQLAADQQAGTFKRCPCGEFNPGTYDVCHFCQRPLPDADRSAHPQAGQVFTPTEGDMEGVFEGVLVSSLGDDGDAVAVTGAKNTALEALDGYFRKVCGQPNLLDDATRPLTDGYFYLDSGHAVFTRTSDGGWTATPVAEEEPGAVAVTWFRGGVCGPVPQPYARRADPKIW